MSVAVLPGTRSQILRLGIGHIAGIPLPGETGNVGIAGHRDTFFRGLKDSGKNDEIQLQTASGVLRYEVDWMKVVANDDEECPRSLPRVRTYAGDVLSVLFRRSSAETVRRTSKRILARDSAAVIENGPRESSGES